MHLIDGDALMKIVKQHHDFFSGAMINSDKARRDELHQVMADIVNAPTVDAIPVEWLREFCEDDISEDQRETIEWMMGVWQREQEAR